MLPQDPRSPFQQQRWFEIQNIGSQTIPPHGACEVVNCTRLDGDRVLLLVRRPTRDSSSSIVLNGLLPVPAGKAGHATNDFPAFCLGYTPAQSQCGSKRDSFELVAGKTGFTSLGIDPLSGMTRVKLATGEATGELEFVELTTSLSLGGFGRARLLEFNATTGEFQMVGDEFRVQDYTRDSTHQPGKLIGAVGYRGWARRPRGESITDENGNQVATWPLIELEQVAEVMRGRLGNDMALSGAGYKSDQATVDDWWNGKSPGTTQDIFDPQGLFKRALNGAKFIARRNDKTGNGSPPQAGVPRGQFEVVQCQSKAGFVSGTLTSHRFPVGGYVPTETNIWKVQVPDGSWWGSQQDIQDPRDANGQVRVWFDPWDFPLAYAGAQGTYAYDAETDLYYPVVVDQMALAIKVMLSGALCGDPNGPVPSVNYDTARPLSPWPFSRPPDSSIPLPMRNSHGHAGDNGDVVYAIFDYDTYTYEIFDAPLKLIECLSDLRLLRDSPGVDCAKVQGRSITVRAESCASGGVWKDTSIRLESIDAVVDIEIESTPYEPAVPEGTYDPDTGEPIPPSPEVSGTCKLNQKRKKVCVLSTEIATVNAAGEITGYGDGSPVIASEVFAFEPVPVVSSIHEESDGIYQTTTWVWTGPCDAARPDNDDLVIDIGPCEESPGGTP